MVFLKILLVCTELILQTFYNYDILLINLQIKEALYRIWCGANRLGDSGVHTLGDNSAFVNLAGQLLLPGGVRPEWIPSA